MSWEMPPVVSDRDLTLHKLSEMTFKTNQKIKKYKKKPNEQNVNNTPHHTNEAILQFKTFMTVGFLQQNTGS